MAASIATEPYADSYGRLQGQLLERYGLVAQSRLVLLARISTRIHLLEAGTGGPGVILHGGAGIGAGHNPEGGRPGKRVRLLPPDPPRHRLSHKVDHPPVGLDP